MNCKEFQTMAVELARRRSSDVDETGVALMHLRDCAACRMRLAEERMLTLRLHHASQRMPSSNIPERVDTAVLSAFERHRRRLGRVSAARVMRARRIWIAAGTALAAAALILSFWTNKGADAPRLLPEENGASAAHTAPDMSGQDDALRMGVESTLEPREIGTRGSAPPEPNAQATADFSTREPDRLVSTDQTPTGEVDFIPIPLGVNDVGLQVGPIVRVEVSGAVLDSLGFPISGDLHGRRIQAEMMLGEDGRARAIRFVRTAY
jgi:hypothetical protein